MIFIDRNDVAEPGSLGPSDSAGATERANVFLHYQTPNASTYPFKAYKGDDVVKALNLLFESKCAYCESRITATGPIDVEHFRPKGKVAEDNSHSGYWWLASDWKNLLPSCIDCNRQRYQSVYFYSPDVRVGEILAGKKDTFPVAGQRAHFHYDHLELEKPLLIDPTIQNPKEHIGWVYEHALPIAIPVQNNGVPDVHGDKSIEVLGLNRIALVEARKEMLNEIDVDLLRIKKLIIALRQLDVVTRKTLLPSLEDMLSDLNSRKNKNKVYSAFASAYIDAQLRKIEGDLISLR